MADAARGQFTGHVGENQEYVNFFQKSQSIVSLTAKRTNWLLTNLMNILPQFAKIRSIKSSHWLTNTTTILRNRILSQSTIQYLNSLHT